MKAELSLLWSGPCSEWATDSSGNSYCSGPFQYEVFAVDGYALSLMVNSESTFTECGTDIRVHIGGP